MFPPPSGVGTLGPVGWRASDLWTACPSLGESILVPGTWTSYVAHIAIALSQISPGGDLVGPGSPSREKKLSAGLDDESDSCGDWAVYE